MIDKTRNVCKNTPCHIRSTCLCLSAKGMDDCASYMHFVGIVIIGFHVSVFAVPANVFARTTYWTEVLYRAAVIKTNWPVKEEPSMA